MLNIPGPAFVGPDADRGMDLQFHLELAFLDTAYRAEAAGWSEDEVSIALLALARNRSRNLAADGEADRRSAKADVERVAI